MMANRVTQQGVRRQLLLLPALVLLCPSFSLAGTPRFARLGAFDGQVEVQLDAADSWRPAARNLPLPESTRIRTSAGASLEIELDDTSVFRMTGDALAELSDYTRLSGGQRITVISLDHGLAYFTGEATAANSIHLLVPGAQATLRQGSRLRLQATQEWSEIAIIEGATKFTIPTAEMDLHQGQSARVSLPDSTHFSLFREIAPVDADHWSEGLDKSEADAPASRSDLDHAGKWLVADEFGTVWQPAPKAGWAPFRDGRWIWYPSVGFAWAAAEPWGWKPYHEGRWLQHSNLGWVWVPPPTASPVRGAAVHDFLPGEVYWARTSTMAAWGPLAPGELWAGAGPPRQYAALNTTGGPFTAGTREIVPSSPDDLPKDLLKALLFTSALPSPPLPVSRLLAPRDSLRTRTFSAVDITPVVPEMTQNLQPGPGPDAPLADVPPPPVAPDPTPAPAPPPPPDPVMYPYPVYTGIVIVNPPVKSDAPASRKNGNSSSASTGSSSGSTSTPASPKPPAITRTPARELPPEHRPVEVRRSDTPAAPVRSSPVSTPAPAPPAKAAQAPPAPEPAADKKK